MQFTKASKKRSRLRAALIGPSGSGKTWTALRLATSISDKVAVIDTERGSAEKYADLFDFQVLNLESFAPQTYVEAIHAAAAAGFEVLVIDSLSHAWFGKEGALEQVDKAAARSQSKNSFGAWREVTPHHNALVDAILQSPCHVIATLRVKTDYVLEKDERTGKTAPRKVGLAPVQRDGLEYEFDVVADMDGDNTLCVTKTRCSALHGAVIRKPGKELADVLKAWVSDGAPPVHVNGKQQAPGALRISPEQREELGDLLRQTPDPASLAGKICAAYSVQALDQLPAASFGAICDRVRAKLPTAQAPAPGAPPVDPSPPPTAPAASSPAPPASPATSSPASSSPGTPNESEFHGLIRQLHGVLMSTKGHFDETTWKDCVQQCTGKGVSKLWREPASPQEAIDTIAKGPLPLLTLVEVQRMIEVLRI